MSVIIHNNSSLSNGSRYCKPEVISWWKVNITVFYTRFLSNVKKKNVFQKLAGLWLVGEVVNHVGLYGSKVAEGCSAFQRRSCSFSFFFFFRQMHLKLCAKLFIYCVRHRSSRETVAWLAMLTACAKMLTQFDSGDNSSFRAMSMTNRNYFCSQWVIAHSSMI